MGLAENMYANDNAGWMIPYGKGAWGTLTWRSEPLYFPAYLGSKNFSKIVCCPQAFEVPKPSYGYNQELVGDSVLTPFHKLDKIPVKVVMLTDTAYTTSSGGAYWEGFLYSWWTGALSFRHFREINASHSDGHADSIFYNDITLDIIKPLN